MIPIDVERLKLMKANGCTLQECATYFGCSVSTIQRRLNPKLVESYRTCNRRWQRIGPIEKAYPQQCKWCGIGFVAENCRKVTCGDNCKRQYQRYRRFFVELSPRQIREHVDQRLKDGWTLEQAAESIGLTVEDIRNTVAGQRKAQKSERFSVRLRPSLELPRSPFAWPMIDLVLPRQISDSRI